MKRLAFTVLLLLPISATAGPWGLSESDYVAAWCSDQGGIQEYRLYEQSGRPTRIDCLLPDKAVEFDWAYKIWDGLGQALYYGARTQRKPVVMLILREPADQRFVDRLEWIARQLGVEVMTMPGWGI